MAGKKILWPQEGANTRKKEREKSEQLELRLVSSEAATESLLFSFFAAFVPFRGNHYFSSCQLVTAIPNGTR